MSDPSFSDTVNQVKGVERKVTAKERDFWNNSKPKTRINLLKGRLNYSDVASNLGLETATENAYQQDYMAKINQLINTSYDSLPESVRTTITEALIGQGALPNPKNYKGIGHEFAVSKEVFIECDRCDQEFLTEEDFDMHKELDHGDYENAEEQEDAEDILSNMRDPEISLEAFKEARRLLTETDEGDLHRSVYFNGDKFPQPTEAEPDDIKGKKGYDDNPNKGLYDNKIFKKGKASSRQDGSVTEATEEMVTDGFEGGVGSGPQKSYAPPEEMITPDIQKELEDDITEERREALQKELSYGTGELIRGEVKATEACNVCGGDHSPATHGDSKATEDEFGDTGAGSTVNPMELIGGVAGAEYEGEGDDVEYDQSQTLSDVTKVVEENDIRPEEISSIDSINFAEEKIDYVYPTIKIKASEAEEKDPFLEEYGDDDIETDKEAVENQVISRKLHGYSPETIAREITIQYGVSHEKALEKVYSIEVSVNDKVSNTFFGKRFHECTEAEKDELRAYSGSDAEDEEK